MRLNDKRRAFYKDRNKAMRKMRVEGKMTLEEIAAHYRVSRQRVSQIVGQCAGEGFRGGRITRTVNDPEWLEATRHLTNEEVSERLGISESTVTKKRGKIWHRAKPGNYSKTKEADLFVRDKLRSLGYESLLLLPAKAYADIIVNGRVTLDVKVCTKNKTSPTYLARSAGNMWTWNLTNHVEKTHFIDLYVLVIWPTKDCFLIPPKLIKESVTRFAFVYPNNWTKPENQKWQKFHERWDLIEELLEH